MQCYSPCYWFVECVGFRSFNYSFLQLKQKCINIFFYLSENSTLLRRAEGGELRMCVYIYMYIMSQTHNRLLPKYNVCVYKTGYSQNAIISTVSIDVSIENHSILNYTVNTFCMSNFRLHPKYIYFNPFSSIGAWAKCVCSLPTSIRQFKLQKKLSVCNTFRYL